MITLLDKTTPSRLSIVCGVKNRLSHLKQALPTWLACPEVDEVVIVDWDSFPSLQGSLFADPRIRLLRVNHQPDWIASRCFNLGLQMATGETILLLGGDHVLDRDFFAAHPLDSNSFYNLDGNLFHRGTLPASHEARHLWGVVYARAKHFYEVGGYDERIVAYGWEDSDLSLRMAKAGAKLCFLDISKIRHIPHSSVSRLVHAPRTMVKLDSKEVSQQTDASEARLNKSILANKAMTERDPWSSEHPRTAWRIIKGFCCDNPEVWTIEITEEKP